jgi:protocatechuate 4,5-dioxygenase alpha chain
MQRHQEYDDIPGSFVFDAERSRQGYGINMFCMSLLQKEKAL